MSYVYVMYKIGGRVLSSKNCYIKSGNLVLNVFNFSVKITNQIFLHYCQTLLIQLSSDLCANQKQKDNILSL